MTMFGFSITGSTITWNPSSPTPGPDADHDLREVAVNRSTVGQIVRPVRLTEPHNLAVNLTPDARPLALSGHATA